MRRCFIGWMAVLLILVAATGVVAAAPDPQFGPPKVPAGFRIAPAVQGVHHPTRLAFGPDGRLYIAQQTGEVVAVTLKDGQEASRDQVATAKLNLLGIALRDDKLWVSETGTIAVYTRTPEGRYTDRKEIVKEIPNGLHQNDGFAWGPDGKLYWGLGTTTDRGPEKHPWSGSVMRMNPDGSNLEVFAHGFRNPYGIGFDPDGNLWVTDNGPDEPAASDELNLAVKGGEYGFPTVFGMPPAGSATRAPVALFGDHNSTDGLAFYGAEQFPPTYRGGIFVAEWGSSFDDSIGRAVGFVRLSRSGETWTGAPEPFVTGLTRPLDVIVGPAGDLWVADFVPGIVYRVWYEGPVRGPGPATGPSLASEPVPMPAPAPSGMPAWGWAASAAAVVLVGAMAWLRRRRP